MAKKKTRKSESVLVTNEVPQISGSLFKSGNSATYDNLWSWGCDNLFPHHIELLARSNAIHRGIMQSKSKYIAGAGFSCDDNNPTLLRIVERANGEQSLAEVMKKVIYDKVMTGNAFIEVAVRKGIVLLFHQDATRCRKSKPNAQGVGGDTVIISKDWANHNKTYDKEVALFPNFTIDEDNVMRSIVHISDYEPSFQHYGVPEYIAGLIDARIGSKTSVWNESRLDHSFQVSGVMEVPSPEDNEEEMLRMKREVERMYAGNNNAGKVLWMIQNDAGGAKFTPIQSNNEGDWANLHDVSKNDLVTAHSWFISLAGLDYTTGISAERMINEYNVALATIIQPAQEQMLIVLRSVLQRFGIDASSLAFINRAPITQKPAYMKIWEARKADGLDYDEADPAQQAYLANITQTQTAE